MCLPKKAAEPIRRKEQMLNINKSFSDNKAVFALEGRLDTLSAPELERQLEGAACEAEELTFDLAGLEYISSAGLRVLLCANKKMIGRGCMRVKNVPQTIMDIFEVTGFDELFAIE